MLRFDDKNNIETVCLSEIADRITRKNKGNETDLPLTISSIDGLVDQRDYFNKKVASRDMSNYFLLKKGEFAYNKSYSKGFDYGSIKMLDKYDKGALSPLYICFALKDSINKEYMAHYFDSQKWYEEVSMICTEGARNHGILNVSPADFMNISLALHLDTEEQQKIADCLSSVDAIISDYEAQVENMQNQKKGVMQKLFSQEVRFKADDGSEYTEWKEISLADAFHTITDFVAAGSFADLRKNVVYYDTPQYAQLVRTVDVKKAFKNNDYVYVNKSAYDYLWRVNLDNESVIILPNIGANIGEHYLLAPEKLPYERNVLGPNAILLRTSQVVVFWDNLFSSNVFQKKLQLIVAASGQPKFNKTELKQICMFVPCLEEQQKIADCLSAFDDAIEDLQKTVEHWKTIKKGLLQQLFA